jgi:phosphoserine phosphatase
LNDSLLPSWRPGSTRDALVGFLDASQTLPRSVRVAAFDNDGTLWCEKPTYVQFDFFLATLKAAAASDPTVHSRAEYRALLDGDLKAMGELGLARIALALADLFTGRTPEEFTAAVQTFMDGAQHGTLHIPTRRAVYQPMIELIGALRARDFTVFVVTGGGTEFVRAVSDDLYGVAPEAVVGTLIEYEFGNEHDRPVLRRTGRVLGDANEGPAKVASIQTQLGRRPIFAAGNSGGDREMLEWTCAGGEPCLALLVDHDDGEREFAYVSKAETVEEPEPITDVARRLGWTVVSMARDWDTVFNANG